MRCFPFVLSLNFYQASFYRNFSIKSQPDIYHKGSKRIYRIEKNCDCKRCFTALTAALGASLNLKVKIKSEVAHLR